MTENMDKFELGIAVSKVYDFAWSEFCDWYIELVKQRLYSEDSISKDAALYTLTYVLEKILKLLHPFMPFITEEIWSYMEKEEKIIVSSWPVYQEEDEFKSEEEKMEIIINAIRNLRNLRAEMNVPPSRKAKLLVVSNSATKAVIKEGENYFTALASASEVSYMDNEDLVPEDAVSVVLDGAKLFIPMDELVDFEKELERLTKEKDKLESEIKRVVGKLNNQGFLAKAPQALVDEEKAKQDKFEQMLDAVNQRLENVKAKLRQRSLQTMNYEQALSYISSTYSLGIKKGTENISYLLNLLDNPQNKVKVIHVAGTNGKGSTCSFISSVLTKAGYKVGLYTSPFLEVFNERMRINGNNIEDQRLADLVEIVKEKIERVG